MNQTEIRKEPRDCFAVLQLFPEPYRQKVRMALESAGGRGVPDRQPLSIGGASHSRQRYTCGLQEIRFRIGRPVLFYIDGEEWFATEDGSLQKTLQPTLQWIASRKEILQLIQEKTIERVSGTKRIELDFRLLVATNRNLEEEVQRGLFRSDLFYRLNVIRVHIPPLRQRPEDILPMAHQFLERFCKEYGKQLALSPRFVAFLEQYPWPGNVRQLENLMERLVITAQNPILDITALPLEYNSGGSTPDLPSQEGTLAERMDAFEGQIIRDSYRRCGTTVAVAKELGISQATAVRKIAKYVKDRKE